MVRLRPFDHKRMGQNVAYVGRYVGIVLAVAFVDNPYASTTAIEA